jgi:phenylpropionate dioxygenase-like ring-hydroxylating dioxygenase large terminal subunit
MTYSSAQLRDMVQPGRVHRRLYSDPDIFEMEMARIFGQAWVYVGHDSQVKNTGDFATTRIGRQPMVMVRHSDGEIYVLQNRCAHRGAMVVGSDKGQAKDFVCCYHGWVYDTDGRLASVPLNHGYPEHFDMDDPEIAMVQAPRVANYRGFVFASLASDGPSLEDFLGHMTASLDDMVDRAPDGTLELAGGVFKHAYDGNWKYYLENLCDAAHPAFVHQSSTESAMQQGDEVHSDGSGEIAIRQMRQNAAPYSFWENDVGIWTYPGGHSYLGAFVSDEKLVAAQRDPSFSEYVAAMEARHGAERTSEILEVGRWNSNIYPNLSFMSQFRQLRVIHPISVNRTEVYSYSFRLNGAPEKMFRDTIGFANIVNAPGSPVLTDDLEIYGRIDAAAPGSGADWLEIGRGYDSDRPADHGGRMGKNSTSEIYIRNMIDAWLGYMGAEA